MKKFKFSLEKILTLRKFKEEQCRLELGQAISALNKIENDIMETAKKKHIASSKRFTEANDIASWDTYILRLDRDAQLLTEQAAKAQIIVEEKRELYLEAQKELKVMEKLREKRFEEYEKESLAYENNQLDDLTSARLAGSSHNFTA